MKTIRLLLLGSILNTFSSVCFSQDTIQSLSYYKILGPGNPNTIDVIDSIKNIRTFDDSLIFEIHQYYRKKLNNRISFTAKNGQIIRHRSTQSSKQHVVFDFNLQENDTFRYDNGIDTFTLLVDSTGFVTLEDKVLRKSLYLTINYDEGNTRTVVWVEGIGTLDDGFYWRLTRLQDGGYTNTVSICNQSKLVYWKGLPEDLIESCNFDYLDTYLGIEQNSINNKVIDFYPNPSSGLLSFTNELVGLEYQIIDLNGKVISSGIIRQNIDIQNISDGVYIIKIQKNEECFYDKLIVK